MSTVFAFAAIVLTFAFGREWILVKQTGSDRLSQKYRCREPVESKNSSWSLPRPRNHCSAYVDDKSGPGGLWEIPGVLNICADREPIAGGPVNPHAASLSPVRERLKCPLKSQSSCKGFITGKNGLLFETRNSTPYLHNNLEQRWLTPRLRAMGIELGGDPWVAPRFCFFPLRTDRSPQT
jgi:hypothetical protein